MISSIVLLFSFVCIQSGYDVSGTLINNSNNLRQRTLDQNQQQQKSNQAIEFHTVDVSSSSSATTIGSLEHMIRDDILTKGEEEEAEEEEYTSSCTVTPSSDWIRTDFTDRQYFNPYNELHDFLEGPGLDIPVTELTYAVCEFRDLSWYFHFPHA
jgi:hypothetical protein